ncbi:hypothetical protein L1885_27230, partial [Streptomyces fuscigenes]|nr:hypothetical protein [Streptomyces fuscigenes]
MPSQPDTSAAGARGVGSGPAGPRESASSAPGRGAPDAGRPGQEPGAAADPAATRHRSLVTLDHRLFLGTDAVTLATPEGFATVPYAGTAEVLAHPDGGRVLTGTDGVRIAVEPTLYAMLTPDRIAALDAALASAAPDAARTEAPRAAEDVP